MIDSKIVELIKEQESYRDNLYSTLQNTDESTESLLNVSEILLKVNLITKEIYESGINDELYDLYYDYVLSLQQEKYLKCQEIHEKITNYINASTMERN